MEFIILIIATFMGVAIATNKWEDKNYDE